MTMYYFGYGSNLASQRLLERLPNAIDYGVATLSGHRLCFRMNHNGESGKCDIEQTDNPDDIVYGVVYKITDEEKIILDGYEMLGFAYDDKMVEVTDLDGKTLTAVTYYALITDGIQPPFHWYKNHVLRGAIEHEFPACYIRND